MPRRVFACAVAAITTSVNADSLRFEEIVVTASKREASRMEVPGTVTVLSSELLRAEGVGDIRAAQSLLPAMRLQQENTSTQVFIRGIGSNLDFPQLDAPSSIHLNGAYVPREANSTALFDLAQLEVLPGPQGTLYGRSTLGGIVNASFARPGDGEPGYLLLEAGNYDTRRATAAGDLAVGRDLTLRLATDYQYRDGYMNSGADSLDNLAGRVSLRWTPGDRFSAYAWVNVADMDGSPANLVVKGVDPVTGELSANTYLRSDPWDDSIPAPWNAFLPFGQPRAESYRDYHNRLAGAEFTYRLSADLVLHYLPAFTDFTVSSNYWLGAFPANKTDSYEQQIHELRLHGTAPWGNWLAGLYGYRMDSDGYFMFGGFDRIALPGPSGLPIPVSIVDSNRIEGVAAFGEAEFALGADWRLTLGGRLSSDRRAGEGRFFDGTGLSPYEADDDYDHVDVKVALSRDIGDSLTAYGAVQSGYMPGTFNPFASTPQQSNVVDAAELISYSIGLKGGLGAVANGSVEAFYYDYDGLFGSAYNTVINATQTFNVEQTEVHGVQLELALAPSAFGALSLSGAWIRARYTDFDLPDGTASFDGFQAQYAPEWSWVLRYHRDFNIAGGRLRAAVSSRYESSFWADFAHTPGGRQQAARKSNAQLTWYPGTESWSVGLWVRNIEDEAVIAATAGGSNLPPNPDGATAFLEAPRTWGMRVTLDL
ncbi:MAG: TonB-dependent receptor plug domain-containing protein [Chromatocurvus sp.]